MRSRLTKNAQTLRKNMTPEERTLWYQVLKTLPFPVKRQKVIGSYIVDFYIPSKQIVIEVDGSQHYEHVGQSKDILRDEDLRRFGITVLRYSNKDINTNLRGVYEDIAKHCGTEE
ncbi:MAG: endonuclease domain-containing protein [Oscillospiraceae bacterium]|nr:endonuclease domain-containing protein [Oscillospiraceae bacterium]